MAGSSSTTVKIRKNNADNEPGDLVATLTNPASLTADSLNTFTAQPGTTLAASKTYWLTMNEEISFGRAQVRNGILKTTKPARPGWSIGDSRLFRTDRGCCQLVDRNLFPADDNQRHRRPLRRHLVRNAHSPGNSEAVIRGCESTYRRRQ